MRRWNVSCASCHRQFSSGRIKRDATRNIKELWFRVIHEKIMSICEIRKWTRHEIEFWRRSPSAMRAKYSNDELIASNGIEASLFVPGCDLIWAHTGAFESESKLCTDHAPFCRVILTTRSVIGRVSLFERKTDLNSVIVCYNSG